MKTALVLLALLGLSICQITQLTQLLPISHQVRISQGFLTITNVDIQCGQNKVTSQSGICIEPSYIEGCILYASQNQCAKCQAAYKFSADKCHYNQAYVGQNNQIIGCLSYDQSNTACINCANGFYLSSKKCMKGVKNCNSYDSLGKCNQCNVEYTLVLSQCRHNSLLGCKYQTESHTCSQCFSPFELVEQHCDIPNCQMLNDYGCVACQCGFYITQNRDCKPISKGCLRYQRTVCTDCLSHFKLKGGICQIQGCLEYVGQSCATCSSNYENINGQCKFKNCYQWLNDSCIVCNQGYAVSNSVCVKVPELSCA